MVPVWAMVVLARAGPATDCTVVSVVVMDRTE